MRTGDPVYIKTDTHDFAERGTMRPIGRGEFGTFIGNAEGPFVKVLIEGSGFAVVPFGALMTEDEKNLAAIREAIGRSSSRGT